MTDGLFHMDGVGDLVAMTATPYSAEDVLQELLEQHPDLLAGGQMTPGDPRRWALIAREQGVPDRDASASRWSIDHLFVDQDAVPTLVEVKRSTDTRIRREVVGQMLDYAANGVRYWPIADLRAAFEVTQRGLGRDPLDAVRELCRDASVSTDGFFEKVADNLRAGNIRLVFVADLIPDELKRITEFLNEQMTPAEVLAVEVKQYKADGYAGTVLVPSVFGRTAAASMKRNRAQAPARDELLAQTSDAMLELLHLIAVFAQEAGLIIVDTTSGSLVKTPGKQSIANLYLGPYNSLDIPLQPLRDRGWESEADALLGSVRTLTTKGLTAKYPTVPAVDAVAHWSDLRAVLGQVTKLYEKANTGFEP